MNRNGETLDDGAAPDVCRDYGVTDEELAPFEARVRDRVQTERLAGGLR